MQQLFLPGSIAILLLIISVVLFFVAIVRKSMVSIYIALAFFLMAMCAGIWAGYIFLTRLH